MSKRISKDYGMSDYYNYYKKNNNNPVKALKFNKIISDFNSEIVRLIIEEGLEYKLPKISNTICVRKNKSIPKIKDGKLINKTPIDWKSTKELWESDPEAKEKKIILRYLNNHTSKYIFRIKMLKYGKHYKNKSYYKFKPARSFQRNLAKRILNNNLETFDAYTLY